MTELAAAPEVSSPISELPKRRTGWIVLAASLVTIWLLPRRAGRLWAGAPLWAAYLVAVACTAAAGAIVAQYIPRIGLPMIGYENEGTPHSFARTVILLVAGFDIFLVMLGFAILPFAPAPGPARPVIRHVARTVMFGSPMVFFWWAGIWAADWLRPHLGINFDYSSSLCYWLAAGSFLLLWTYAALARAAAVEYRRPGETGAAREPRCDDCGYDLHTISMESRCPECGKAVVDCLGDNVRPPTEWERNPSYLKIGVILRQFGSLVTNPLALFRVMPITTGLTAARKWLGLMLVVVFAEAFWVIPSIRLLDKNFGDTLTFDQWPLWAVGTSVGILWAFLGLMMVGIETAGVTIVSRWRKQPIELAHAAKVTCYSSTLLFIWVILGGLQVNFIYWWALMFHGPTKFSQTVDSMVTVCTFGAAHIAGLILFEYTVYRGLRAVMYAVR